MQFHLVKSRARGALHLTSHRYVTHLMNENCLKETDLLKCEEKIMF